MTAHDRLEQHHCSVCAGDMHDWIEKPAILNDEQAAHALHQDILAIVGQDEYDSNRIETINAANRNQLRAELRQRLDEYFKGGSDDQTNY